MRQPTLGGQRVLGLILHALLDPGDMTWGVYLSIGSPRVDNENIRPRNGL